MFGNLRNEIYNIYQQKPEVANDDKLLISVIWKRHGWDYSLGIYENLKRVPSAETIRRTRQKLVQEGIMKTSDKAIEKRYKAYRNYYNEFGG